MKKTYYKNLMFFIGEYDYQILEFVGIISGIFLMFISNFFIHTKLYYFVFALGIFFGFLGFILEYYIKKEKNSSIDKQFKYFLQDLSIEYKNTKNISLAISNVSSSYFYGAINDDIKKLEIRVSWGESFEDALKSINKNLNNAIIDQTILLLEIFSNLDVPFDIVLLKISKDINMLKEQTKKEKFFKNIFNLTFIFFILFLFLLLFVDYVVGKNFMWVTNSPDIMSRVFFDNFLLYIALLLAFFTSFVMYFIKDKRRLDILKYSGILFIITIILFQIFIPKPDAGDLIVDSIKHMQKSDIDSLYLDRVISLKSISSKYISKNTDVKNIYFLKFAKKDCLDNCKEYNVIISKPVFLDILIKRLNNNEFIIFYRMSE